MTTRALASLPPGPLLEQWLDTPDLPAHVRSLEPEALHQLIRHRGLEDCAEIVALATAGQITRVLDEDLWDGEGDHFDAGRFGLWLQVLAENGAPAAAERLTELDFDLVTAGVGRHVLVLDAELQWEAWRAAHVFSGEIDPDEYERRILCEVGLDDSPRFDVGGFRLISRDGASWEALVAVLVALEEHHPEFFSRLMRRCHALGAELILDNHELYDVLTSEEQATEDARAERDQRREQAGYVTAADARAFLALSREGPPEPGASSPDPLTARYFREREPRRAGRRSVIEGDEALYARHVEELAYLANVLVAGTTKASRRLRPAEAVEAVRAVCKLGLAIRGAKGAEGDLVSTFQAGWRALHHRASQDERGIVPGPVVASAVSTAARRSGWAVSKGRKAVQSRRTSSSVSMSESGSSTLRRKPSRSARSAVVRRTASVLQGMRSKSSGRRRSRASR
jgi:hypothetical protein